MDQPTHDQPAHDSSSFRHDFFDVYKLAIDDLHRTRGLAQKIDSLYVTILTLLLTGDAYEVATSRFDNWGPVVITAAVALIGAAVTARWRQGAGNLFAIVTNRYTWLRDAEKHPEMQRIRADIFGHEWEKVYIPQMSAREKARALQSQDPAAKEAGFSQFYIRTTALQTICLLIFAAIPLILAIVTYLNLNPTTLRNSIRLIFGG